MSEAATLKYRAFISYSHADTGWARWLPRGLESFHIDKDLIGRETATGTIPAELRPIFRDRDEFTAGKTLTEQTRTALDASAALIVICSPAAAKSRYVNEEIRAFKSRHPERPVIPLMVAGKPGDPNSECFPPALKFKLDAGGQNTAEPDELLAADAQEQGDGKNLALAKVVAGLIGVSSDEIFRRADRERRAALRHRRRVQGVFALLVLARARRTAVARGALSLGPVSLGRVFSIVGDRRKCAESKGQLAQRRLVPTNTKREGAAPSLCDHGRHTVLIVVLVGLASGAVFGLLLG